MKSLRAIKLGTTCRDSATGLMGMITHLLVDSDLKLSYAFQPRGLDDKGQPLSRHLVEVSRLIGLKEDSYENIESPVEVLGTQVSDKASGFSGMAVGLVYHISGCVHVVIQPKGRVKKTGQPISTADFDLRRCEGPAVPCLTPDEVANSQQKKPSPTGGKFPERQVF